MKGLAPRCGGLSALCRQLSRFLCGFVSAARSPGAGAWGEPGGGAGGRWGEGQELRGDRGGLRCGVWVRGEAGMGPGQGCCGEGFPAQGQLFRNLLRPTPGMDKSEPWPRGRPSPQGNVFPSRAVLPQRAHAEEPALCRGSHRIHSAGHLSLQARSTANLRVCTGRERTGQRRHGEAQGKA